MNEVTMIGVDLAKSVFQAHGATATGEPVFRKKLSRGQFLKFLSEQPPCVVAMEACASSHYWGREIMKLGHDVRLIPPIYVKPFVKCQKNDANDAEAIGRRNKSQVGSRSNRVRRIAFATRRSINTSTLTAASLRNSVGICLSARRSVNRAMLAKPVTAYFL